ncbi:MAG TPA: sodium/sugar symporter [Chitinophagaceae bacterium]|nr:sodium/sugar symporter [Chitinophagaceae bacterium]
MSRLHSYDYFVFFFYFIIVAAYGYWIYWKKKKRVTDTKDFFLAEGALTWWAIGASLIASNISAEQFIGMSGSGFKMGLAIASYEWMAALTLIIVAVFFMPVYLKNKIYTMPQFLSQRYNSTVAMIMAIFWLLLYVVVNLMSILYLGAIAISGISGLSFYLCISMLALFAIFITLGGMKVIGYTDVIQVLVLILGGLAATYLALDLLGERSGQPGVLAGFKLLRREADDHFHMIFSRDNPNYMDLPGLTVLLGGMWIANLSYWGCNQYITQRALGANLKTARNGLLFAAYLKLLMPVIVVLPGIAAYVLHQQGMFQMEMLDSKGNLDVNKAYPSLLNLLPVGLKGLAFAALTAAIVASLAGKANSISTIFILDIYKKAINRNASEQRQVFLGRIVVVISMVIAVVLALLLGGKLMGEGKQGFQYIQEYTGFVSPGIFAMFFLGFFWKKTTSNAALFATIGGFVISVVLKSLPGLVDLSFLAPIGFSKDNGTGLYEIPFLDRMGITFLLCILGMWIISRVEVKRGVVPKGLDIDRKMFRVDARFAIGALIAIGLLTALYAAYW